MPAQTRTSNRTQQISYVDPPEPMDYDSYQQPEPTQPPQTFSHPLSLTDDQPFLLAPQQQLQQQPQQLDQLDQPVQPTPARRGRKPKSESGASGVLGGAGVKSKPPVKKMDTGGVEVKTKFPTARIKRIMQADEDVGKVAQVTPVVVGKSCFVFHFPAPHDLSLHSTNTPRSQSPRTLHDPPHHLIRHRRQIPRQQKSNVAAHEARSHARRPIRQPARHCRPHPGRALESSQR